MNGVVAVLNGHHFETGSILKNSSLISVVVDAKKLIPKRITIGTWSWTVSIQQILTQANNKTD